MNRIRFILLGAAMAIAISGCGSQERNSAGQQGETAQAAAQTDAQDPVGGAALEKAAGDAGASAETAAQSSGAPGSGAAQQSEAATSAGQPSGAAAQQGGEPSGSAAPAAKPGADASEQGSLNAAQADAPSGASQAAAGGELAQRPAAGQTAAVSGSQSPAAGSAGPAAAPDAQQTQLQQAPASASEPEQTALTISITGSKDSGVILSETSVPYVDGLTVIDLLKQVTKEKKLQMEYQGKGPYAYVQGIDNLYEFDEGPKSGWIYKVNGTAPGEGAGAYKLAAGDKVEWVYTLDLGKDVGAKME